jgi:hypothetical protein
MQLFVVMGDSTDADFVRKDWLRVEARWDVEVSDSPTVLSDQDEKLVTVDLPSGGLHEADSFVDAKSRVYAGGFLQSTP